MANEQPAAYDLIMVSVLESHLSLHEREVGMNSDEPVADRATALTDVITLHVNLFDVLERRLGSDGVTESHRPLVPLFQRWLGAARKMSSTARELIRQGHAVAGLDDLAKAMNRSKPVAEDFDYFVALNQRIERGEPGNYRPMNEVFDELRNKAQQSR